MLKVSIAGLKVGKDQKIYLTIFYPSAINKPTLVFPYSPEKWKELTAKFEDSSNETYSTEK